MIENEKNSHGNCQASQKNGGKIQALPGSSGLTTVNGVHRIISLSPDAGREFNIEVANQDKSSNSMGLDEALVSLTVGVNNDDILFGEDTVHAQNQLLERGEVVNSSDVGNVIDKTDEAAHRKTNDPNIKGKRSLAQMEKLKELEGQSPDAMSRLYNDKWISELNMDSYVVFDDDPDDPDDISTLRMNHEGGMCFLSLGQLARLTHKYKHGTDSTAKKLQKYFVECVTDVAQRACHYDAYCRCLAYMLTFECTLREVEKIIESNTLHGCDAKLCLVGYYTWFGNAKFCP